MALAAKHMRASYTAWFIAYYFVAIGATWLLSAPRYLIALLPVPLSVSMAAGTTARDGVITAVSALLAILYLYAFVMRWQVWGTQKRRPRKFRGPAFIESLGLFAFALGGL